MTTATAQQLPILGLVHQLPDEGQQEFDREVANLRAMLAPYTPTNDKEPSAAPKVLALAFILGEVLAQL